MQQDKSSIKYHHFIANITNKKIKVLKQDKGGSGIPELENRVTDYRHKTEIGLNCDIFR